MSIKINQLKLMSIFLQDHMYEGEFFRGSRTVESLQNFVLSNLNPEIDIIDNTKWHDNKYKETNWLLFLCGHSEHICPERQSILKLTAMLVCNNYL